MERLHMRAAATIGLRRICVRPNDGNSLDVRTVQGKDVAVILQQHETLARCLKRDLLTFRIEQRDVGIHLLMIEESELDGVAKNTPDMLVTGLLRDIAGLDRRQQRIPVHEYAGRHFEIESTI